MTLLSVVSCQNESDSNSIAENEYPKCKEITQQKEFFGIIRMLSGPPTSPNTPVLPVRVVGLQSDDADYLLVCNGNLSVSVAEMDYQIEVGDMVKVDGTAYEMQISAETPVYRLLHVETITLLESGDCYNSLQ